METQTNDLEQLVLVGRKQGYLTYDQVNEYLPDEANTAEKLDQLLIALERAGVNIVEDTDVEIEARNSLRIFNGEESVSTTPTEMPKLTNDPIRLYLSQMCEIPLLTREQEIALAKKIEITRRKFRRAVLGNDFALRHTVEILRKVAAGILQNFRDKAQERMVAVGWIDVGPVLEIPESCARVVSVPGGEGIAVFRYDGKVAAVSNQCAHQMGPLGEGRVIDGCITCPWHGWQYDPATGRSPPPFVEKVATYSVRMASGRVFVNPKPNTLGVAAEPARIG